MIFFTKRTCEEKYKLEILKWNKANNNCLNIWEGFSKFVLFGYWPNVTILCKCVHYLNKKRRQRCMVMSMKSRKRVEFLLLLVMLVKILVIVELGWNLLLGARIHTKKKEKWSWWWYLWWFLYLELHNVVIAFKRLHLVRWTKFMRCTFLLTCLHGYYYYNISKGENQACR